MCHHLLMNRPLKPSGPGDLSHGISLITLSISSCEKGAAKSSRLPLRGIRSSKSKSISDLSDLPILSL
uniref:Uncharacterized protein n=1 Tax=Arundo donax TaxID=35708 RepID=A0A0A8Y8H4_ARUDO